MATAAEMTFNQAVIKAEGTRQTAKQAALRDVLRCRL